MTVGVIRNLNKYDSSNESCNREMERVEAHFFACIFRAYLESSDEVQGVIKDMVCIVSKCSTASAEEREAALDTLVEALFPTTHGGELGIDLGDDWLDEQDDDGKRIHHQMQNEEEVFANNLSRIMKEKKITQEALKLSLLKNRQKEFLNI